MMKKKQEGKKKTSRKNMRHKTKKNQEKKSHRKKKVFFEYIIVITYKRPRNKASNHQRNKEWKQRTRRVVVIDPNRSKNKLKRWNEVMIDFSLFVSFFFLVVICFCFFLFWFINKSKKRITSKHSFSPCIFILNQFKIKQARGGAASARRRGDLMMKKTKKGINKLNRQKVFPVSLIFDDLCSSKINSQAKYNLKRINNSR